MKKGLGVSSAMFALIVFAAFASSATAQQPATMGPPPPPLQIKAGISDPVNTVLAWYMARAAGLYSAQGLNVEILNMNGGSRGAEELQAARIDVMHVGLSSVVKVNQAGGDLRVIGSLSNVIRFTFFSAPGVKTAADLKGGVVGVSTFGSESDSTVTLALQKLGLTRDDVTVKEYGGGMKRLEAVSRARSRPPRSTSRSHRWRAKRVSTCWSIWCRIRFRGFSAVSSCARTTSPHAATC